MTDAELLDTFSLLAAKGHMVHIERNGSDISAACFNRTGYGATLREALEELVLNLEKDVTERVARKLLS